MFVVNHSRTSMRWTSTSRDKPAGSDWNERQVLSGSPMKQGFTCVTYATAPTSVIEKSWESIYNLIRVPTILLVLAAKIVHFTHTVYIVICCYMAYVMECGVSKSSAVLMFVMCVDNNCRVSMHWECTIRVSMPKRNHSPVNIVPRPSRVKRCDAYMCSITVTRHLYAMFAVLLMPKALF